MVREIVVAENGSERVWETAGLCWAPPHPHPFLRRREPGLWLRQGKSLLTLELDPIQGARFISLYVLFSCANTEDSSQ